MKSLFTMMAPVLMMAMTGAAQAEKLFDSGETHDLRDNKRFKITEDVIKTFKVYRTCSGSEAMGPKDRPVMVSVSVITDLKTGKVYHENTTFRHVDDGDNTTGWIEVVDKAAESDSGVKGEGVVVAEIGDSFLDACK